MKAEFNACPQLLETTNKIGDLNFEFDKGTPSEMIENLKTVAGVFQKILPAWKSCPAFSDSSRSNFQDIKRVTSILEIFASPSKYDLYQLTVKAFSNWNEVNEATLRAVDEL